jgi:SSS family solute:Na+ symporter
VGFGLLWIPIMKLVSAQLYQYLQSVQAYISPPIAAVFLLGILWKRVNAQGAMASLLTGFVLGVVRLVLELNKGSLDGVLLTYASINFLHFAIVLFVTCALVLVGVSLLTAPPAAAQVEGITFQTATPAAEDAVAASKRGADRLLTALLIAAVGALWWFFS